MPKELRKVGLKDGKFFPCVSKHVCVSTQSAQEDKKHYIKSIKYEGSRKDALNKIINAIKSFDRTKMIEKTDDYLHIEFTTALFKFHDDVEFYFDEEAKIIHFKSQSRIGGYDWGANRKRMEKIRALYHSS